MKTPSDEARRIVGELRCQMRNMPEKLQSLPDTFFRALCDTDDIAKTANEVERTLIANAHFAGRKEYLLAVFRVCVHAAASTRLSLDKAWPALIEAQRHAGVALALIVSSAEAREAKTALARYAKKVQTKINDGLRHHVLDGAALSTLKTPSAAAANIVRKLEAKPGGLSKAVQELGSDLTPEPSSLARAFAGYITKDMERLGLRSPGQKIPQPLNREIFSRWKKLYVSPADG